MRLFILMLIAFVLLTACSKVPSQSSYPYSLQHKVQSVDHWKRIANDVVSDQVKTYIKKHKLQSKVHVSQTDQSDFGIAFRSFLASELYRKEISMEEIPAKESLNLDWSVQTVKHSGERKNPRPVAGILGAVGYLAMEFVGGDFYYASDNVPNYELIVSTRLAYGGETVSVRTDTFYIDNKDTGNYWYNIESEGLTTYIQKGSIICKDSHYIDSINGGLSSSRLDALKALGYCAVMSRNQPVKVINQNTEHLTIQSLDNPQIYYTTLDSTSSIYN